LSYAEWSPSAVAADADAPRAKGATLESRSTGDDRANAVTPLPPNVRAATDARLSWDAQLRFRASGGEHLHDLQAGQDDRVQGVFQRLRLGSRFETDHLEARLQLQVSGAFGAKGPGEQPVPVGLQAGSLRWKLPAITRLSAEVGRMALEFGSGRHIARYDFHDEGHAYDGARLTFAVKPYLRIDGLGVKLRRNSAQPDEERTLFGIYLVGQPFKPLTTDVYLLVLRDGSRSDRADLQTMGLRLEYHPIETVRIELEGALQVGTRQPNAAQASLDHLASAASAEAGFEMGGVLPWGVGLLAQQYSGDDGLEADRSRAWRPLYPDVVRHIGLLQLFAQTGLRQVGMWVRLGDPKRLHLKADARMNSSLSGARVSGFSGPILGTPGQGWRPLGTEIDIRLSWPALPGSRLLIAAGVFSPSADLAAKLGDQVARQLLLQWTSNF